jgi:hypothetical protein
MRNSLVALVLISFAARAETSDQDAIRATCLDYIEGWYTADAARMERSLHPDLAKRMVYRDEKGRPHLHQLSAMGLVQGTRDGGGKQTPAAEQEKEVTVLDVYQNAASAKIVASGWIDYLHLARWNGQWKIVNVLWELKPKK